MYQLYKCKCRKEFILITEYLEDNKGHYISCPYCGNKKVKEEGKYSSLKECMNNHDIYKRINGAMRQVR